MIHFIYLLIFAVLVSVVFGAFAAGNIGEKVRYSLKLFAQFLIISLLLAWIFYFIPW